MKYLKLFENFKNQKFEFSNSIEVENDISEKVSLLANGGCLEIVDIIVNEMDKKVSGTVNYLFEVNKAIDTIKIDAQKMIVTNVKINNKTVKFTNTGKTLNLFEGFKSGKNTVAFNYEAIPKQTMYFNGHFDCAQCDNCN